jgi:hypothetical protein
MRTQTCRPTNFTTSASHAIFGHARHSYVEGLFPWTKRAYRCQGNRVDPDAWTPTDQLILSEVREIRRIVSQVEK